MIYGLIDDHVGINLHDAIIDGRQAHPSVVAAAFYVRSVLLEFDQ